MNLEQCREICSSGWPSNQREQARFDAEQWLIQEVERLTIESDGNLNEGFNAASDYLSYSHSKQSDEIAELKRKLEEITADRNECLALAKSNFAKLLESKARVAQLRYAIDAHLNPCGCLNGCEFCNGKTTLEEALALPHDDTALKEYRNAVIDSVASKFSTRGEILATDEVAAEIRVMKGGE